MKRWIFMVFCCVSLFGCFLWLVNNNLFEQANAPSETEPTTKSLKSVDDMLNEYEKIKAEEERKLKNLQWFEQHAKGLPFPPGTVVENRNQSDTPRLYSRNFADISRDEALKYYDKLKELCEKHISLTVMKESIYFQGEYNRVFIQYSWNENNGRGYSNISCQLQTSQLYGNFGSTTSYGGEEAKWFEEYFGNLPEPDFKFDFVSYNENDGIAYATFLNLTEEKTIEYIDRLKQYGIKETYFLNETENKQMIFIGKTDDMTVSLTAYYPQNVSVDYYSQNLSYAQFTVEKTPVENPQTREFAEKHFGSLKLPHEFSSEVIYRNYSADGYGGSHVIKLSSMDYQKAREYLEYLKKTADFVQLSSDNTTFIQFTGNFGDDFINFSYERLGRGELSIRENHVESRYSSVYIGLEAIWDSEKMHGVPTPEGLNITTITFTNDVSQTITVQYSMDDTEKITRYIELLEESGYEKINENPKEWAKDNIKITIVWSGDNNNYGGNITITNNYEPAPVYTPSETETDWDNAKMYGVPAPEGLNVTNIDYGESSDGKQMVLINYQTEHEENVINYMKLLEISGYENTSPLTYDEVKNGVFKKEGGSYGFFYGLKDGIRVIIGSLFEDGNINGTIFIMKEDTILQTDWDNAKMHGVPAPESLDVLSINYVDGINGGKPKIMVPYSAESREKVSQYIELLESAGFKNMFNETYDELEEDAKINSISNFIFFKGIKDGVTVTLDAFVGNNNGRVIINWDFPEIKPKENLWSDWDETQMYGVPAPEGLNITSILTEHSGGTVRVSYSVDDLEKTEKYMELLENSGYMNVNKEADEKLKKELANQHGVEASQATIKIYRFEGLKEGVRVVVYQSLDNNKNGTITITKEE